MSLPDEMMKHIQEQHLRKPDVMRSAAFKQGQKVRIKASLTVDTFGIEDVLGKVGTVAQVQVVGMFFPKVQYMVRVGTRVEPFYEDELDMRYAARRHFA